MSSSPPDVTAADSPKHLTFVIDFGDSKTFDSQRHKTLVEKLQNRHKRGQSLSKLDELPKTTSSNSKKQPSSGKLPRKNSFQSEGYFSYDERGDHIKNNSTVNKNVQYSRIKADLKLPLKNINSDKMTRSFPNDSITLSSVKSPHLELQDVSSPELDLIQDLISPLSVNSKSPKMVNNWASPGLEPWEGTIEISDTNSNKFVDRTESDFNKSGSNTPSEAGTYTLDTDNYTEEQKARMSIDKDFNIEQTSGKQRTEEYVQSLNRKEKIQKLPMSKSKTLNTEQHRSKQSICLKDSDSSNFPLLLPKSIQEQKMKVISPILSPTQNLSITDKMNSSDNTTTPKVKEQHANGTRSDKGCFTSITASGAFGCKKKIKHNAHFKAGLTKSQVETQTYIDSAQKTNNTVQGIESPRSEVDANGDAINSTIVINRFSTLPPAVGGYSGKNSPTKIPSPVYPAFNRPRSCNSTADSDSSLETESFLKPTQNFINSLQKRLSLDSNHEDDIKRCNLKLNNELQKMAHIRHNSFDDKNLQISNKLEHFQNKSLQAIDQTYINKFNQFSTSVHKINNSPNRSPVHRASSFSTNQNVQRKVTNLTMCSSKSNNLRNSPKLEQSNSAQSTVAMNSYLVQMNLSSINADQERVNSQLGDSELSSDEEYERNLLRKKDLTNLTSTRYNRAFALRRARLDQPQVPEPTPKCPNTPEMRRKFKTVNHTNSERAVSVDRRLSKTCVSSRYLQSVTKIKTAENPKNVPNYPSEKSQPLSRNNSGRISIRTSKPNLPGRQKNTLKDHGGRDYSGGRSNSSLSSREVEFQNWKRRKSYDPMKAAAEGKKKIELAKKQCQNRTMTQSYNENQQNQDCDSSPSHSSSVLRSQSFHGTAALAQLISSEEEEDDLTLSADEGFSPPVPSPYKLSPARVSRHAWRGKLLN